MKLLIALAAAAAALALGLKGALRAMEAMACRELRDFIASLARGR